MKHIIYLIFHPILSITLLLITGEKAMKNKTQINDKENQHYVPKCYMKNFATIAGVGRKEKAFIAQYQFDKAQLLDNIPTKSICYEKYFYGDDLIIENEFSHKEAYWGKLLRKISESSHYCLNNEDERQLKMFAVYQNGRTLAALHHGKKLISEILNSCVTMNLELNTTIIKAFIDKISPANIVKICNEEVNSIDDLKISIIKYKTTEKLITSDMPIIITNPFSIDRAGLANVGAMIFFPVSSDTLVVIHDDKIYSIENFVLSNDEQEVVNLNKFQVISAEERIIANKLSELQTYAFDKSLLLERKEYQAERKVDVSYDGKGTFMAAHSRSIPYKYELSFCKLPKQIINIPRDCRRAFQRKYEGSSRFNLLVCAYRLPDLMFKNGQINDSEMQKRKDGYLNFLKFMDDYWEIPYDKRTITPKVFNEIESVEFTYIPI